MIDEFIGDAARQKLSALEKLKDTGNLWQTFSKLSFLALQAAERLSRLHMLLQSHMILARMSWLLRGGIWSSSLMNLRNGQCLVIFHC